MSSKTLPANKGLLADEVSRLLSTKRRTAMWQIDHVLEAITLLLAKHGGISIKSFGTFRHKLRKGRPYKHPVTGEVIKVPDRMTIVFSPSDELVSKVDRLTKQKQKPSSD